LADKRGDVLRNQIIQERGLLVVNIPPLEGDVSATQARVGIYGYLFENPQSGKRFFSINDFFVCSATTVRELLGNNKLMNLLLRQKEKKGVKGINTPRSIQRMLPKRTVEEKLKFINDEKKLEDKLLARLKELPLRDKTADDTWSVRERSEGVFFKDETGKKVIDDDRAPTTTFDVVRNGKIILSLKYYINGSFYVANGEDYNELMEVPTTGEPQNARIKGPVMEYLRELNDAAQNTVIPETAIPNPTGGIDFNINNVDLNVDIEDGGVQFKFDPATLQNGSFGGLVPVILNVTPIADLPMFLSSTEESKQLAGAGV
jgi:hypothetical protein